MSEAEKCENNVSDEVEEGEETSAKRPRIQKGDDDDDDDVVEVNHNSNDVTSSSNVAECSTSAVDDDQPMSTTFDPKENDFINNGKNIHEIQGKGTIDSEHSFAKDPSRMNVLMAVTGSVATIKIHELVGEIMKTAPTNKVNIRIVTTKAAQHFFDASEFGFPVYTDEDEWSMWKGRGDPIMHIELRKWADMLLIAPLDANTMAKIANGICDNLLTCVTRAWDVCKPVYFCPAMNTYMYEHPLTFKHMEILTSLLQFKEIPSIEKELMCGDKGYGAMAPVQMIASVVVGEIKKKFAVITDCTRYPMAYQDDDD